MRNKWDKRLLLTRVTDAGSEPITTSGAKTHLRVTTTDDDTYIGTLITVARRYVEETCGISLINQTWDYWLNWFPDEIELPRPPLSSITAITYVDEDGDSQALATSVYTVDTDAIPGRVYESYDQTWPTTRSIPKAIKVRYVGGYASSATGVPDDIKQAILILVSHWYENREPIVTGTIVSDIPLSVDALLAPYKVRIY